MKLDASLYGNPEKAAAQAVLAEAAGFAGAWITETGHSPFLALALAASRTTRLELGTGVAIALARSPMTLAQEAWDLAELSRGRLLLGLGSQVKAHVTKRFSMPWDRPVDQMRDMVGALRAIWDAFQNRAPLRYEGKYYRHTLLTPFFSPEPMEHHRIPVMLAGVGPKMTELAGEVADGILLHPFTHQAYLDGVTFPSLDRGLARAGRSRSDLVVAGPVFMITGEGEARGRMEAEVRRQIAFYGSTPAYAEVLATLGHQDLHQQLHKLSREGKWEEMGRILPEDVVEAVAVRAPLEDLPGELRRRFAGIYDRIVMYLPLPTRDPAQVRAFTEAVQA